MLKTQMLKNQFFDLHEEKRLAEKYTNHFHIVGGAVL
jgi:hypothetical protein